MFGWLKKKKEKQQRTETLTIYKVEGDYKSLKLSSDRLIDDDVALLIHAKHEKNGNIKSYKFFFDGLLVDAALDTRKMTKSDHCPVKSLELGRLCYTIEGFLDSLAINVKFNKSLSLPYVYDLTLETEERENN